jgi:hypothetical protein
MNLKTLRGNKMKSREVMQKLESGEITIDLYGHRMTDAKEDLLSDYHRALDCERGGQ